VGKGDINEKRLTDLFEDGFLDLLFLLEFEFFSVDEVLFDFLFFEADEIFLEFIFLLLMSLSIAFASVFWVFELGPDLLESLFSFLAFKFVLFGVLGG
jgi:hypothetical protein